MKAEREKSFSSFCVLWKTEWKNMGVPSVGGDALIAPPGATPEQSEKTHTPVPSTPRVDVAIAPCMEYAENGRSIIKCFCAIAAISQKALFPLPSSLLMCYADRNKTVTVKPTGNGGKSFRKGMFP